MILNQPFPCYSYTPRIFRFTFYSGLVVFIILILFRPFGFDQTRSSLLVLNAALYGIVTFALASANSVLIPKIFPRVFKEENWTVGREIFMVLWQIISIAFANMLLTHFLYGNQVTLNNIVVFLGITAAVGIFPVGLVILLKQQILLKKYSTGAPELEKQIIETSGAKQEASTPILVHFTGDNQNEELTVSLENIRYITSADNYIKIFFLKNGLLNSEVLRSSLKKAALSVENHPQLFRCHRTYIVNLTSVDHVSGNAQGYKLHLKDVAEPIPVSRSLNNKFQVPGS
jgi:DNA-binding LytR/AlgR family response regulator